MSKPKPKPAASKRTGRKPLIIKARVRQTIIDLIARGVPREQAFLAADVNRATFYRWLQAADGDGPNAATCRDFRDALEKAEARAEANLLEIIEQAAADPRNWTAAAWTLERRWPDRYGRRMALEHKGQIKTGPAYDLSKLTTGELEAFLALASKAEGDDPPSTPG